MAGLALTKLVFLAVIAALATALIVSIVLEWFARQSRPVVIAADQDQPVFLFHGRSLVDATSAARHLLVRRGGKGSEWDQLVELVNRQFPGLRHAATDGLPNGQFLSKRQGDDSILEIDRWDDMTRVTLHEASQQPSLLHPLAVNAMEEELETLRRITQDAPQLMWREDASGTITWANRAYLALADQMSPGPQDSGPTWPPHRIFELAPGGRKTAPDLRRVSVQVPGQDEPLWFDIERRRQGAETTHFACDARSVVLAEKQGRKFVQTLTKTFAQLSIGLAIFDRQRHLVMFNPALLDLTHLPVEFLSGRPLIQSFLDRLRDRNMLPEPKNYASWREQVSALETQAEAGTYCESWTLPGGQTYRVTGRPHPDGAIAFTFEDITAEIALTRHFRSELETAQNVLEAMDEAIAVFSAAGTLTMSNAAYASVWGHSAEGLEDITLRGEIDAWQKLTAPTPVWDELRQRARQSTRLKPTRTAIRMTDGRSAVCRCVPLAGGSSLVAFQIAGQTGASPSLPPAEEADLPELVFRRA